MQRIIYYKIFLVFWSLKFKEKYFLSKKNCPSTFQLLVNFKIFLSHFKSVDDNGGWMEEEPHINACRQGWWMLGIMTTISHYRHRQTHGAGQEQKYHHH